jgi:hypothetical protein
VDRGDWYGRGAEAHGSHLATLGKGAILRVIVHVETVRPCFAICYFRCDDERFFF